MIALDVHVLLSTDTPASWSRQCISSIVQAARRAGYPVAVHQVPGVPGHIGRARATGYALGTSPWVTCVDDDDLVLPDASADMAQGLASNAAAVSTAEMELRNDTFRPGGQRHHLIAYRRERIIDHAAWSCCGDVAQRAAIGENEWHDVRRIGYLWRVYPESKARALRIAHPAELERAHGH